MNSRDKFLKNTTCFPYRFDPGSIVLMGEYDEGAGEIEGPLTRYAMPTHINLYLESVKARDVRIASTDRIEEYENPIEFWIRFSDMTLDTIRHVLIYFGYDIIRSTTYNMESLQFVNPQGAPPVDLPNLSEYTKARILKFPRQVNSNIDAMYICFGNSIDGIEVFEQQPKRFRRSDVIIENINPIDPLDISTGFVNFICDSNDRIRRIRAQGLVNNHNIHRSIDNADYVRFLYPSEFTWGEPHTIVSSLTEFIDNQLNTITNNDIQTIWNYNRDMDIGAELRISALPPSDIPDTELHPPPVDFYEPVNIRLTDDQFKKRCGVKNKKGKYTFRKMGGKLMRDLKLRDTLCVICSSDIVRWEQVGITPCKHVFHKKCLKTWLTKSCTKPTCPCCRHDVRYDV